MGIKSRFDQLWDEALRKYGNPESFNYRTRLDIRTISAGLLNEKIDRSFKKIGNRRRE